jgi:S-adenosylmethionine:tRNA ribosyltransferase-isomerase
MHLDRNLGIINHHIFYDIGSILRHGDLIVLNNSRVIPARLIGTKANTAGAVEVLLLHREGIGMWKALVKPGHRLRKGSVFTVDNVAVDILEEHPDGIRSIYIHDESIIHKAGLVPLPPYINTPLKDKERYQTVYAKNEGSAAAPTAGLHFTNELLESLKLKGVRIAEVTLNVGLASFRPVKTNTPNDHALHSEYFEIDNIAANEINAAKSEGRRIICIGTTSVRVLEQAYVLCQQAGATYLTSISGWANIFILPGHQFRLVDGILTNFHLPKSTLLMLISAFGSRDFILDAYQKAIYERYRFYSFGDAMLIT